MAKVSLGGLKKHSLWIGCGLAILVGVVCWFLATGRLVTAYRANKSTVESKFKAIDDRRARTENRSEKSLEGIRRDIADVYQRVKRTWEAAYHQQAEQVFVWPEGLSQTFRDTMKKLPPDGDIPERLREEYQNYVRSEFHRIGRTIDSDAGDESEGPRNTSNTTVEHAVHWRDADRIEQSLTWKQSGSPSSTWIRLRQEDLWIYGAFCKAIQAVNKGVTGRTSASIKLIDSMEVADAAARTPPGAVGQKRVKRLKAPQQAVADAQGGGPGGTIVASTAADDLLKDRRYVDVKGRPLIASELAASSPQEFKLVPFRLSLLMDQRDIDRLLVEFRNSVLPIEVWEVRINGGGAQASMSEARDPNMSVHHKPVEFRGVVYIYNPPALKKPDFIKDTDTTAVAEAPAAAQPEAAPAQPTTDTPAVETPVAQTPTATPAATPTSSATPAGPGGETRFVTVADGKLKLKGADDAPQELELGEAVEVTIDGAPATMDDLKADMIIEVVKENDKVTAIKAKAAPMAPPAAGQTEPSP